MMLYQRPSINGTKSLEQQVDELLSSPNPKYLDVVRMSELLGHSHDTMTLSRYATGYTVHQLKNVIELLHISQSKRV